MTQPTVEMLTEHVKSVVEQVNELAEADSEEVDRFLTEDVLEVRREQTHMTDGWMTEKYILVVTTGGPHIEFDITGEVVGYWGSETVRRTAYSAEEWLTDEFCLTLNEIYGGGI